MPCRWRWKKEWPRRRRLRKAAGSNGSFPRALRTGRSLFCLSLARIIMLAGQIEWILLITGLATAGALGLFLAPVPMTKMLFGQAPPDALSLLVVRHFALLVCLVGALLVSAADHAEIRVPTLMVAIVEKAAFALAMFISPFRRRPPILLMA